jgi:hypothetical protein
LWEGGAEVRDGRFDVLFERLELVLGCLCCGAEAFVFGVDVGECGLEVVGHGWLPCGMWTMPMP